VCIALANTKEDIDRLLEVQKGLLTSTSILIQILEKYGSTTSPLR
jgi:hypothetical protein